ncbi:MAG: apolipoprotein N-acyltransferase, partial [Betaproteobacteria bacterium]
MTLLWMLASAAAGAMSTVPHVHTESWWWGPLAAAVLAHAVWRHPPRVAAACAWAFGTAWMVAGTWWLFISLNRYGGMPAPLAAASVFALGAALSLYWAAAMGLVARWRSGLARWDVPAFAAAW